MSPHAATTTGGIGHCDRALVATKAFHVSTAALAALLVPALHVVAQTIQNGLGSNERRARAVGA